MGAGWLGGGRKRGRAAGWSARGCKRAQATRAGSQVQGGVGSLPGLSSLAPGVGGGGWGGGHSESSRVCGAGLLWWHLTAAAGRAPLPAYHTTPSCRGPGAGQGGSLRPRPGCCSRPGPGGGGSGRSRWPWPAPPALCFCPGGRRSCREAQGQAGLGPRAGTGTGTGETGTGPGPTEVGARAEPLRSRSAPSA